MECKHCGLQLRKDDQFCSSCGYPIDDSEVIERKKDSVKAFLFLTVVFIVLSVIIYGINKDFDGFLTHELPLQLSDEDATKMIKGSWMSQDENGIIKNANFTDKNFRIEYTEKGRYMSGTYSIEDSNTVILYINEMNSNSIIEELDMVHKFHFDNEDTLVIIFNGISNTFDRQK